MTKKKKSKNIQKFLLAGVTAVSAVLLLNLLWYVSHTSIPHYNPVDAKVSLYSDKYISPNAIVSDPALQKITFDTTINSKKSYPFSNQVAAVVKALKSLTSREPKPAFTPEYGSWIWTPVMQMTPEYVESVLSDAKRNGVNAMYISIDGYLDIFAMPKGEEREKLKKVFGDKLEDFIARANRKGIAVDAEAGWRNWAEEGHTYKAFAVANYAKNFNAEREHKFRGFQYDIEPYLLDEYKKDQTAVLKNFVGLVDKTEDFLRDSNLKFSVVIPDFYDEKDEFTPKFSYNKRKASVFRHLLNIMDRRLGNSIIIMSYRSFADGYDGSIEISQNEMRTAEKGRHKTRVIIAQETGDVPPPYITFHNISKSYLSRQIGKINGAFGTSPNFGGVAIHYVNAFLTLK